MWGVRHPIKGRDGRHLISSLYPLNSTNLFPLPLISRSNKTSNSKLSIQPKAKHLSESESSQLCMRRVEFLFRGSEMKLWVLQARCVQPMGGTVSCTVRYIWGWLNCRGPSCILQNNSSAPDKYFS